MYIYLFPAIDEKHREAFVNGVKRARPAYGPKNRTIEGT